MASKLEPPPLTRGSVKEAHEIVKPYIHLTPVLTSKTLNSIASTPQSVEALKGTEYEGREPAKPKIRFFFKCENYQRIGAFKARGAFHAISQLPKEIRDKGVVTHSSGKLIEELNDMILSMYRESCAGYGAGGQNIWN
jgi:threonine dehydratase